MIALKTDSGRFNVAFADQTFANASGALGTPHRGIFKPTLQGVCLQNEPAEVWVQEKSSKRGNGSLKLEE